MSGFVFFIAMYVVGDCISGYFGLPVPGAIVGLILALAIFVARGGVDAPLRESADTFLRYLSLMLVPLGVGMMKILDDPARAGVWKFAIVLVLALMLGAVMVAKIMQVLLVKWVRKPSSSPRGLGYATPTEGKLDPVIADS
jgi:holin-like protein